MRESDKPELYQLVADVLAHYGKDASEFTLGVWWEGCKSFDLEQVRQAVTRHVMDPDDGKFPITLSHVTKQLAGTRTDRAAVAWGVVLDAMKRTGAYRHVSFGNAAIHAAIVDCGGWPKVCRTELRELQFLQQRFQQAFTAYVNAGAPQAPLVLDGDIEPDEAYTRRGLPAPAPVLIDNPLATREHRQLAIAQQQRWLAEQLRWLAIAQQKALPR